MSNANHAAGLSGPSRGAAHAAHVCAFVHTRAHEIVDANASWLHQFSSKRAFVRYINNTTYVCLCVCPDRRRAARVAPVATAGEHTPPAALPPATSEPSMPCIAAEQDEQSSHHTIHTCDVAANERPWAGPPVAALAHRLFCRPWPRSFHERSTLASGLRA